MAEALSNFQEALKWLDWLDQTLERSRERCALRGSLHKRWAASNRSQRLEHLRLASAAYSEAAKLANAEGYRWQNALALNFILDGVKEISELREHADSYLEKAKQPITPGDRDFWKVVAYPDALLHSSLVHGTLAKSDVLAEVTTGYEQARRIGPTPREWASVRDHIWFLAAMTRDQALQCHDVPTADALDSILDSLINSRRR